MFLSYVLGMSVIEIICFEMSKDLGLRETGRERKRDIRFSDSFISRLLSGSKIPVLSQRAFDIQTIRYYLFPGLGFIQIFISTDKSCGETGQG